MEVLSKQRQVKEHKLTEEGKEEDRQTGGE